MKELSILGLRWVALPIAALMAFGCSDDDTLGTTPNDSGGEAGVSAAGTSNAAGAGGDSLGGAPGNTAGSAGVAGSVGVAGSAGLGAGGEAGESAYDGPSVGRAKTFAALAYSAITAANISTLTGDIGVSAGATSTITGFDAAGDKKYGIDSLAPNDQRTILAQGDVTALVGNIDPRACDADYTNVVGGLTGDITLHSGVTCMNSFSADVLVNGHVTLDAKGDPNAFFIIRGNLTMTVADAAQVILANGAQPCGVFWEFKKQVTIGKTVAFYGTVIAGTAITMSSGSTLGGRALAQTAGIMLDANAITIPLDADSGVSGACTHVQ